ncbi:MAG: cupin domain-containing protein, partial [Pseudomonadota bacterium]
MSRGPKDALSDALAAMRVSGTLLLNECYRSPWGLQLPAAERLAEMFQVPPETLVIPFHLVVRGGFDLDLRGDVRSIAAGEVAICFAGGEHTMSEGAPRTVVSLEDHLAGKSSIAVMNGATELVCGVFLLRDTRLNPLYRALPRLAVVSASDRPPSMAAVAQLLVEETRAGGSGSAFMSERIVEMLLAEVVRAQLSAAVAGEGSWFSAVRDPRI